MSESKQSIEILKQKGAWQQDVVARHPLKASVAKVLAEIASPTAIKRACETCGKEFDYEPGPLDRYVKKCSSCLESEGNDDYTRLLRSVNEPSKKEWHFMCPSAYQNFDPERLPNPKMFTHVMHWKFGAQGLLLHGTTGTGKTRCAWELLHREYDAGRKFKVLDSMSGIRYASKYSESASAAEEWVEQMIDVEILLMDDVFKNKLTDSFEGAVFTIVDQRLQKEHPIIVTTNDTGSTLTNRMTGDRAEPFIRRLKECCTSIRFSSEH